VVQRALRLRSPEAVVGNGDTAKAVAFDALCGHGCPFTADPLNSTSMRRQRVACIAFAQIHPGLREAFATIHRCD
jgi:hypothetical protein